METAPGAAVLFADVSDSTHLYELAGDAVASNAINHCVAILRAKATACGGRVIKTIGDEIMVLFASVDAAAQAAITMQSNVALINPVAGMKIGVGIGFNYGPVLERDGDAFGDTVNVAARLTEQAQANEIITSVDTMAQLSPSIRMDCRRLYAIQLKGKSQAIELAQLVWRWDERLDNTLVTTYAGKADLPSTQLRLRHGGTEIVFDAARAALLLGRDPTADLVVHDAKASRLHCRVERRLDKFVIVDHSANGTYVTFQDDQEVVLKREELPLHGHGWITLGRPRAATEDWVEFTCETPPQ